MNPFLLMSPFYLWFNQSSKVAFNRPSSPVSLSFSDFEYNLNAFGVERVYVNPYTLIENAVDDLD
jgi:hypothetical protein